MSKKQQSTKFEKILKWAPQALCISIFVVVVLFCAFDFKAAEKLYYSFIKWIHYNPYTAISAIILFYIVSICFVIPIAGTHVAIGFTYSQVFKSQWKGYILAVPIAYIGCMLGALCALLMSRYLFKNFIKN